jgi:4-amino-4-deoxy-L-arabinose transferase-like glycosyltransferase
VSAPEAGPRRFSFALGAVLTAAAALRLAHFAAVRDEPFVATLALDAAEYDRWARALAAGDWLGSEPFFQAPLYPYALGALYFVCGRSLDLVYLVQIALGVAGLAATALAARRLLSQRHALAAAALGALAAPLPFHEVQIAKEGPAAALAGALLLALARARERGAAGAWLGAGILLGALALLRENALLLVPFLLPLAWRRRDPRGSAARSLALLAGLALPLAPVAARHLALGGGLLPTTFQGGANFWIGNSPEADGTYRPLVPGKQIPALERSEARRLAEEALGRPLAAREVSRYWVGRALAWARAEPLAFLGLQLRKVALYLAPYEWPDVVDFAWLSARSLPLRVAPIEWGTLVLLALAGLWLRRRALAPLLPVALFEVGWLAATVAFFLFARYRLPAIPGLLLLGAIPLVALADAWRAGARGRAALGGGLVVLLAAAVRLAAPGPRLDLVEYNLGRMAEETGRAEAARAHYERALAADPAMFLAEMNLGTLAAKAGSYDEAAARFARAAALEPRSDDAWANLGGAELARGRLGAARAALARALALHRTHPSARANLALLERLERRR